MSLVNQMSLGLLQRIFCAGAPFKAVMQYAQVLSTRMGPPLHLQQATLLSLLSLWQSWTGLDMPFGFPGSAPGCLYHLLTAEIASASALCKSLSHPPLCVATPA